MEEKMQKSRENNTEKEHPGKRPQGYAIRFLGCWLLTVALAAGIFLLWIYVSFEMRLSAQVIRAGLMAVYILPCFLGARMIRRSCLPGKIFWGAFLGLAYYALLILLSFLWRKTLDIEQLQLTIPLMCTLSGIAGTLRLGKTAAKT